MRRASGVQASSPARQSSASQRAQLVVGARGVEHAPHDELWSHGAVPAVLLQPEGDVEVRLALQALELAAEPERDRAARVASVLADAEAEVLALADRRGADRLAAGDEQRHVGVAEAERARAARARGRARA